MKKLSWLFAGLLLITACNNDDDDDNEPVEEVPTGEVFTQSEISSQDLILNSSGNAPLAARLDFETSVAVQAQLRVIGKNGFFSDAVSPVTELATSHSMDVLGLYPDHDNVVELWLYDENGNSLGNSAVNIQTDPVISDMPIISVDVSSSAKMDGMTFVSYFGYDTEMTPFRPFIFDEFGDIRWYLDFSNDAELSYLNYDDGMERLQNGNLYFGHTEEPKIYEINMQGEILNEWGIPGYDFHHQVLEKPNGNFLVTVNKDGLATIEDHIIEVDRASGNIINEWDLRQSLQESRQTLTTDEVDWIHVNAIEYDESDNTIIISGRTQGVIKLDENNNVVWIISPHEGWGTAGDGTDLTTKLLQPLDANGNEITDSDVLLGNALHDDFDWVWYQHAPKLKPDGNLMIFDNGQDRHFGASPEYSRAVEYKIDKSNMTIQQMWEYGKERGSETYSRIVSDVDFHSESNHVVFSPGAIASTPNTGKAIEIDYATKEVVYETTITPPTPVFIITFHRTQRLSLYPE